MSFLKQANTPKATSVIPEGLCKSWLGEEGNTTPLKTTAWEARQQPGLVHVSLHSRIASHCIHDEVCLQTIFCFNPSILGHFFAVIWVTA